MKTAGWVLIWAGVGLIIIQSFINWIVLLKSRPQAPGGGDVNALNVAFPSLKDLAELLKAPHGAAITLVIIGAVLLLASSGVDVSFGASTSPTPSPTATP